MRLDLFLFVTLLLFLSINNAAAQNPIRVQSDQVLVPTVVFDQKLYAQLNKMEARELSSDSSEGGAREYGGVDTRPIL